MKINITNKSAYAEEGQPNPMRWLLLSRNEDGSYKNESAWLKCKDFFNDLAYTIQTGKSFTIYGFNAGNMNPSKKGESVYMLLDVLTNNFVDNLVTINEWLVDEQGMPYIEWEIQKDDKVFIKLPPEYFKNTYNISLITLIIRLLNYDDLVFKSFKDLEKCKKFPHGDQWKWDTAVAKGIYFNLPKELEQYIWYQGKEYNNIKKSEGYDIPGLVHNCGLCAWTKAMV